MKIIIPLIAGSVILGTAGGIISEKTGFDIKDVFPKLRKTEYYDTYIPHTEEESATNIHYKPGFMEPEDLTILYKFLNPKNLQFEVRQHPLETRYRVWGSGNYFFMMEHSQCVMIHLSRQSSFQFCDCYYAFVHVFQNGLYHKDGIQRWGMFYRLMFS